MVAPQIVCDRAEALDGTKWLSEIHKKASGKYRLERVLQEETEVRWPNFAIFLFLRLFYSLSPQIAILCRRRELWHEQGS